MAEAEQGAPEQVGGTVEHSADPQEQEKDTRVVYLPSLIADEFGTSPSEARMQIATGKIEIDGKEYRADDRFNVPYADIVGKTVAVIGETRHFKVTYRGDSE